MTVSLGIRLVIILPTLLFLIGFVFKGLIERNSWESILKNDGNEILFKKLGGDFMLIFAIESIFLFMANGLIIIFELQRPEIGIIAMILGILFSVSILVGLHASNYNSGIIGFIGIFGLLSGELTYFSFFGSEIMIDQFSLEEILTVSGIIIGVIFGKKMDYLLGPNPPPIK